MCVNSRCLVDLLVLVVELGEGGSAVPHDALDLLDVVLLLVRREELLLTNELNSNINRCLLLVKSSQNLLHSTNLHHQSERPIICKKTKRSYISKRSLATMLGHVTDPPSAARKARGCGTS